MFDVLKNTIEILSAFILPVVLFFGVLLGVFFCLCYYWYVYFTKQGMKMEYKPVKKKKRENMLYQLFVLVPRRFVLDLFEREKDYFDPFGIHIFCGEQGSGKTIGAVEFILRMQEQYPQVKCITNFGLTTENDALAKWQQLLTYNNGKKGVIVGIDEIQNWFMAGNNQLPKEMLEVVSQNRKNRRIIVGTSQVFTRMNKGIREQATLIYEPTTFLHCFTVVIIRKPVFDSEGNVTEKKYKGMYSFVHTDEIRNAYDTYKVIRALAKEGFKEPVVVDLKNNVIM